jgi:DNA-binding protein WhiA
MLKEKTNEVNRKKNCDIANITKSITASGIYVDAILALMESGDFDKLSPELKQTAKLRLENDTLTLSELAALENPPISKSQVSKRLQKIHSLYKSLQQSE